MYSLSIVLIETEDEVRALRDEISNTFGISKHRIAMRNEGDEFL